MEGMIISSNSGAAANSHKRRIHNDSQIQSRQEEAICGNKTEEEIESDHIDVEGKLNPIFIPSIINHVASFLSCADLKRCRFLNKQWKEECSKHLRRKGLVKLSSKSAISSFYMQFLNNQNFYQNFSFEITSKGTETDKFFEKFGPSIKCLKLDFSGEYHSFTNEFLYDLIFTKLPNLQELSLVGCISEDDHFLPQDIRNDRAKEKPTSTIINNNYNKMTSNIASDTTTLKETYQVPTTTTLPLLKYLEIFLYNSSGKDVSKHPFLIELLGCVPNMEKISVPKVPKMLSFGMPLLHTLITTTELYFSKLQHLDMDVALYNGLIDVLKSKRFPLKYLNAEINSAVSEDSLHSLLETYGKTLETLQLKFPRSPVAYSEFRSSSNFQVLRHLTLHGYKGPLTFLEQLMDLQSLELIDNSFTAAMNREGLSRLLEAQLNYKMIWTDWHEETYAFDCSNSSDAQLLRVFSKNFLNLTSLNLPHLNDHDLRVIYQTFSHSLQELTMENPLCSDCGLTGMSSEALRNSESIIANTDDDAHRRTHSFIGNLTRLRRLEILTPSIDMTDASIIQGIVYCESLKILILQNAAITDTGLRMAIDSMDLTHLETTMCANIRGAAVKYALENMTQRGMTFIWNKHQNRLTSCCVNRILCGDSPITCIVP